MRIINLEMQDRSGHTSGGTRWHDGTMETFTVNEVNLDLGVISMPCADQKSWNSPTYRRIAAGIVDAPGMNF